MTSRLHILTVISVPFLLETTLGRLNRSKKTNIKTIFYDIDRDEFSLMNFSWSEFMRQG